MSSITDKQYKTAKAGFGCALLLMLIGLFVASPWAAVGVVVLLVFFVSLAVILKKKEEDRLAQEDQRYENMYRKKR